MTTDDPEDDIELPASESAMAVIDASAQPDASPEQIAAVVEKDPSFTLRLLSLVNSGAYGGRHTVSNVHQAAGRVGLRGLRNLALTLLVSDMAPATEAGQLLLAGGLRRALAARELAIATRFGDPDGAFAAGLLLDVGLLAAADQHAALDAARSPAEHRILRERTAGLPPHPEVGCKIARRFHLPKELRVAIRHHHAPEAPEPGLARLAWVAERVAAVFEGGPPQGLRERAVSAGGCIDLSAGVIDGLVASLPVRVQEAGQAMDRELGEQRTLDALLRDANQALLELNQEYERTLAHLASLLEEKDGLTRELTQANERLDRLAATDELTALPNRRALFQTLDRDVGRSVRDGSHLSLVLLDLDHFKRVNDTYGHPAGDEVLRLVASVLRGGIRAGDLAARYGGEEFALILPATSGARAVAVAERLRRRIAAEEIALDHATVRVTASFGVASGRGASLAGGASTLLEQADEALYRAKSDGRDCVRRATASNGEATPAEGSRPRRAVDTSRSAS